MLLHLFDQLNPRGSTHNSWLVDELSSAIAAQGIDARYIEALGYIQEDACELVVPLIGGALVVPDQDEKV